MEATRYRYTRNKIKIKHGLYLGDCEAVLQKIPDDSVDLIFTSPPYANQRKNTYGGIHPDDYVDWFLPKTEQMLRILKPTGTFILKYQRKSSERRKRHLRYGVNP